MTPVEIFEQQWNDAGITVPYYETVNKYVDTNSMPDQWASSLDQPDNRVDVTMGSHPWVDRTGTIMIGLFSRSGGGAAVLDDAVKQVRDAFHGFAKNGLEIQQVNGPHDIDPQSDGEWWRVVLSAQYVFYERRDATGPGFGDWVGFPAS